MKCLHIGRLRSIANVFAFYLISWERVSHWVLISFVQLVWLSSGLQGASCLHFLSAGFTDVSGHTWLFTQVLGIWTYSLLLQQTFHQLSHLMDGLGPWMTRRKGWWQGRGSTSISLSAHWLWMPWDQLPHTPAAKTPSLPHFNRPNRPHHPAMSQNKPVLPWAACGRDFVRATRKSS